MMSGSAMMISMGWLGMVTMLLFWAGVLVLILWVLLNVFPTQPVNAKSNAVDIVRQRYARGEMTREEYLQAVETLG